MFSRQFIRSISHSIRKTSSRSLSLSLSSPSSSFSPSGKVVTILGLSLSLSVAVMTREVQEAERERDVDISAVKRDIATAIENEDKRRGDGTSMAPTLIRLAWHASGTYSARDNTGGSNGATMRFPKESEWGANAGLKSARDFLEPIKKKYPSLSYADLWTLAGATAVEEMGGPKIAWRPGRTDSDVPTTVPDGRLPAADSGCVAADVGHLRDIFGRMGFNDQEIVVLAGAHAVGRCHTEASGYWGPWTNAETTFSNEYFRLLLEEKWTLKKTHQGEKWTGPAQYENPDGSLMMLPADISLVKAPEFRPYVELYAKDEQKFFNDFSAAFGKLMELGVKFPEKKKSDGFFGYFVDLFK